ncbi:hypothetical protein Lepto7375DRAFT_3269 [Leptolyngbya sp. PCC 7375]|nr:hypothetical protein Lepto7375DRAFT_3269 [Leptolyngbya sp. PCC 7375]
MLNSSHRSQVETVSHLVDVWAARYRPNFSALEASARSLIIGEIYQSLQAPGCRKVSEKLNDQRVVESCKLAAVRAKDFYVQFDDLDLQEITSLARLASCVYRQLLEFYQAYPAVLMVSEWELEHFPLDRLGQLFKVPNLSELSCILEPLLNRFGAQSISSDDGKSLGFMTTQISLTNTLLLQDLDPVEQALMSPYLHFLEDHIAVPWRRLCVAAGNHRAGGPVFGVVERMLPMISDISRATYTPWSQDFPYYCGRRGRLDNPDVRHSSLRDFNMFQVYLWLSFLQSNSKVIVEELVPLCRVVYGQIGISWEMTMQGTKLLIDKLLSCLEPHELSLVSPFASNMINAFIDSSAVDAKPISALRYPLFR